LGGGKVVIKKRVVPLLLTGAPFDNRLLTSR